MKKRSRKRRDSGFSLIEAIIALVVASLIIIVAAKLLTMRSVAVEDTTSLQEAETAAESALSALTASAFKLNPGGTFSVVDGQTAVTLNSACDANFCDIMLAPEASEASRTSSARGVPYSSTFTPATGSSVSFIRRWKIEEINSSYGLRRITVGVFKDASSNQPVVIQQTTVGGN